MLPLAAALLFLAALVPPATAKGLDARPGDRALGAGDAPITMIEYYSLDCPHCAGFHRDMFPHLRGEFIETGKLPFVFRDFPLSWAALEAAILAHCAPPERFVAVQDALYKTLTQWSKVESTAKAVARTGETQDILQSAYQTCIDERKWER